MTEKEYREYDAINYSSLSKFDKLGPKKYKYDIDFGLKTEGEGINFGQLVDCVVFSEDDLNNRFAIIESKPSDSITGIVDALFKQHCTDEKIIELNELGELIINVAAQVGYGQSWKQDTLIKKVVESGSTYFQFLQKTKGKTIVSENDIYQAKVIKEELFTNKMTSFYFVENSDSEILFQYPLLFNVKIDDIMVHCKMLPDILSVNRRKKIIKIADLKTMGGTINSFPFDFIKWRYALQSSLYSDGVVRSDEFAGYEVEPFDFIVAEKFNFHKPRIFRCDEDILTVGRDGGKYLNTKVRGYKELITDLVWHREMGMWEYPKKYYEQGYTELSDVLLTNDYD